MGIQPPFLYDPVGRETINSPFNGFDFKASPRAPKPPPRQYEIPLVNSTRNSFASNSSPTRKSFASSSSPTRQSFASVPRSQFDKHPDSYTITPYGNTKAKSMKPSTKMFVTRMRVVQLVLRCVELLGSLGLLAMTILISNIPSKIGLIIRIPPGVAIIHTVYAIYHLSRRPAGRTPGSSASYMLFASCFDISLLPFYGFTAILSEQQHTGTTQSNQWSTLLPEGQSLVHEFSEVVFLLAVVTGGLYLISLFISIWLAITFRKISNLPPDMNPLEDNLTSRHKKSTTSLPASEKRLSEPLESKRSSGAAYENLLRPPKLPFEHARNGSVESFSTYHSTPPPSRGSQTPPRDLPPRHYQIPSPRSSLGLQTQLFPSSQNLSSISPKRSSYTSVPLSDEDHAPQITYATTSPLKGGGKQKDAWFTSDSISKSKKPAYEPLGQQSFDNFEFSFPNTSSHTFNTNMDYPSHQNNPSPPRISYKTPTNQRRSYPQGQTQQPSAPSALSERNTNRESVDISTRELTKIHEESRDYSSLEFNEPDENANSSSKSKNKGNTDKDGLKGMRYGDLIPRTPPLIVGSMRQISTGADVPSSFRRQRDVSGKVVEEGRAGGGGWGERLRRASGRA